MRGIDLRPGVNHGNDLAGAQISQGEVVGGRKGEYVAFAGDRLSFEEARLEFCGL